MQGNSTYMQDVPYIPIARHKATVPTRKMKFFSSEVKISWHLATIALKVRGAWEEGGR